jgi:hypothetical protein
MRAAEGVGVLSPPAHGATLIPKQAGFPRIKSLQGGMLAWADAVDQRVPKY